MLTQIFAGQIYHLRRVAKGLDKDVLSQRRGALANEISTWRNTQARLYPQLEDLVALKNIGSSTDSEDEILILPFDVDRDHHQKLGREAAASYEFQLREGEANEAVTTL